MMTTKVDDGDSDLLKYQVRLLIKHPDIDPARITSSLGLDPNISAIAGSARETPAGTILSGVHKVSLWSHSFGVKGNRRFFSDVEKMIKKLESHKALLAEISNGGGTIDLIIHLPGDINIGDVFLWRDMARLSALQISLGIEVFPNFD
jgi:hypothetical protein